MGSNSGLELIQEESEKLLDLYRSCYVVFSGNVQFLGSKRCHTHSRGTISSSTQLGDMALSDNASLCLTSFICRLAEIDHTEDDYKELIQHTLLESVRRGLKSKTEVR